MPATDLVIDLALRYGFQGVGAEAPTTWKP
jgi:hypothetical protein